MSGGFFEMSPYHISDIVDQIERKLDQQGKEKDISDSYLDVDYYNRYPEERIHPTYPEKTQEILIDAIKALKIAYIYTKRVDRYLSGDDGDESLVTRLEEDLKQIK